MSKPKKGLCGCTRALFRGEDKVNLAERERTVCRECEANKKERTNKMKKLMIAAVAAALVGGAYADAAYDFVATLKTTKAKPGTVQYTTYNLGMDANGDFWYEDEKIPFLSFDEDNITFKTIGGTPNVPCLKTVNGKLADENIADILKVIELSKKYVFQSAGRWCCTVKLPSLALCYRVVGTRKIQEIFYVDECCTDGANPGPSTLIAKDLLGNNIGAIKPDLLQLFGAQSYEKANKGEIYASVKFKKGYDWSFDGWLAGQGSFGKIVDSDGTVGAGPTTINGNIVGTMDAPECEYCCADPEKSVAFDCKNGATPAELDKTAGFGSFRLKFNRSKSNF